MANDYYDFESFVEEIYEYVDAVAALMKELNTRLQQHEITSGEYYQQLEIIRQMSIESRVEIESRYAFKGMDVPIR